MWKYPSPAEEGFHEIISPENSVCKITWIYRLNLLKNTGYLLCNDYLELNGAIIQGSVELNRNSQIIELKKFDSFYLPAKQKVIIKALADCSVFIGGGIYEGKGWFFTRKYDLSLPLGDIHQVHGKIPYKREVFLTVAPQDEGSRLICGITYGDPGAWTSWPPHQHTKDLFDRLVG